MLQLCRIQFGKSQKFAVDKQWRWICHHNCAALSMTLNAEMRSVFFLPITSNVYPKNSSDARRDGRKRPIAFQPN